MKNKKNKIRRCHFVIKERDSESPKSYLPVKILYEGGKIWVQPKGYGNKVIQDGYGFPISLEIWQGRLRLVVFNNINSEDAKIVDLEDARESNRVEEQ
jgi:hypothetical protein